MTVSIGAVNSFAGVVPEMWWGHVAVCRLQKGVEVGGKNKTLNPKP
jgi:hypothetical protein